jgi:predicted secreted protein
MKTLFLVCLWLFSFSALATQQRRMFHSLGSSPKGQFVAIEEYGLDAGRGIYFSRIKLMNVWKKEYVGPVVEVERTARLPLDLDVARKEARVSANEHLERYQIKTSG